MHNGILERMLTLCDDIDSGLTVEGVFQPNSSVYGRCYLNLWFHVSMMFNPIAQLLNVIAPCISKMLFNQPYSSVYCIAYIEEVVLTLLLRISKKLC